MNSNNYKIFSEGKIGNLTLVNRIVRSATWDPCILKARKVTTKVLSLYEELAKGGTGMIISGGLLVLPKELIPDKNSNGGIHFCDYTKIEGIKKLADVVHRTKTGCKIIVQLEFGHLHAGPSKISSPFSKEQIKAFSTREIQMIVDSFAGAIVKMKEYGFDGVQVHAAHTGMLSRFLSPYTNRRNDKYGGSVKNRTRIIREIVAKARKEVKDFPILIKMNCTDYLEKGTNINTFPGLAREVENAGFDAIEISGGMKDCLIRPEKELGFRPVPAPESHTRIKNPEKQSYYLKYAEKTNLTIPIILVGGNRDFNRLEEILCQGKVDFIALCRPLISEPDLPNRWIESLGNHTTDCISCNSCIYFMVNYPELPTTCVFKHDKQLHKIAQKWLVSWVKSHVVAYAKEKESSG